MESERFDPCAAIPSMTKQKTTDVSKEADPKAVDQEKVAKWQTQHVDSNHAKGNGRD